MIKNKENTRVLLFDGVCNLCNGAVNFVIDHDPDAKFKFASLQSVTGRQYLERYNMPLDKYESFVLVESDGVYTKSTAALKVAKELKGIWQVLYLFIAVPKPIRDFVYNFIARNRYTWFGKEEFCRVATPELRHRFLE
jgi:predicted DCC family thiol-disulfide oxidoreductase YuxK